MKLPNEPVSEEALKSIDFSYEMCVAAFASATRLSKVEETPVTASAVSPSGARFVIPLLIPEEVETGDGRSFKKGALSFAGLPLPLMWQMKTKSGHDESVIVGRIDRIERTELGLGNVYGVFDTGPYGREAERLVRGRFLTKVSADLDTFEATAEDEDDDELSANKIKSKKLSIDAGRVVGATLVAKPAFQCVEINLLEDPIMSTGDDIVADGVYEEFLDDIDNELAALAASAAPVIPPREWFNDPKLTEPTPLTITDDGRVFGHIAAWHVSHIGLPRATKPPRSASGYAYFRTGVLRTDDGKDVQVGQLTLSGGHAPLTATAADAIKHYDDTNSSMADVTAGEDRYGIWVAGALRPDVTPSQVRAFRASAPSGDWRPINGRLELVAVCAVNVPGFPVARTMVAGGQMTALVAAGAAPLMEIRDNSKLSRLEERVDTLESRELAAKREAALARLAPLMEKRNAELEALAASAKLRVSKLREEKDAELAARMQSIRDRFYSS